MIIPFIFAQNAHPLPLPPPPKKEQFLQEIQAKGGFILVIYPGSPCHH